MISFFSLFGLDLDRAMRPIELIFLKCDRAERRKRLMALGYSTLFLSVSVEKRHASPDPKYYFVKSLKRGDYDLLFHSISDQCEHPKASFDITEGKGRLSIAQIFRCFLLLPLLLKVRRNDWVHWLFMYLSLVKLYGAIRSIPSNKDVNVVVFADMQPLDNLLVQQANRNNQRTTTLQHGLYVDYGKADEKNVNIVNYLNAEADHFLAWGENTAGLIKRYHPEVKTFLCGKPTLVAPGRLQAEGYFTVIFDQNIFFKHNVELLKIAYAVADQLQLKVNIRLHPNNKIEWVKTDPHKTLVNEDLNSSAFVVGHTSSLIYECMRIGIPAFRYKTDVPALDMSDCIVFSSAMKLLELVESSLDAPEKLADGYIKDIGSSAERNYRLYFDEKLQPSTTDVELSV
ncbi:hypothetical protein GPJ81_00650 [Pseudomonas alkylphenolica]|jgi:hypothetical protein|uniref:Uncharacterized protein n=1 Tax=Pseudomonas alkylphenolica TaxID=237609 RepID=A0A6I6GZL3_9PSED|nr:hypothetical protein [Pseudomonas alkylphenolica]QGW75241.1 hypothetical protein GPJ81_00650 [Pseudomonas alkylphenolica]